MKKDRLEARMEAHFLTRILTSHVIFAFTYGIFLFLYELKFFRELIPVLHPFLIVWAIFMIAYDICIRDSLKKMQGSKILLLFVLSTAITVLLNMKVNLLWNMKAWILSVLPLFTILPVCQIASEKDRKKIFIQSLLGAAVVIFLAALGSLILYLFRFGGTVEILGVRSYIGLAVYDSHVENSGLLLFGLFADTNHAAVYAVVFSLYSVILFYFCRNGLFSARWKNVLGQVFAVANIVVQSFYFPLANSRGGWLSLCASCFIILTLYFMYVRPIAQGKMKRTVVAIGLAAALTAGVSFGLLGARYVITYGPEVLANAFHTQSSNEDDALTVTETVAPPEEIEATQNHTAQSTDMETQEEDVLHNELPEDVHWGEFSKQNESFGSGRIELWTAGLKMFTHRPIFGEAPQNNAYYAKLYGIGGPVENGKALHNSYLDLLVDYGLCGTILMMAFLLMCAVKAIKRIMNGNGKIDGSYMLVCVIALMIGGGALLLSCMFITTTAMYFMLLMALGYLLGFEQEN